MTDFERFFADEFPRLLASVESEPGLLSTGHSIQACSWDRKAAYLVWIESRKRSAPSEEIDELLV